MFVYCEQRCFSGELGRADSPREERGRKGQTLCSLHSSCVVHVYGYVSNPNADHSVRRVFDMWCVMWLDLMHSHTSRVITHSLYIPWRNFTDQQERR